VSNFDLISQRSLLLLLLLSSSSLLCACFLTPWSRVLLEKLTSKKPPVPILSQLHPVPTTPSNFLKILICPTLSITGPLAVDSAR